MPLGLVKVQHRMSDPYLYRDRLLEHHRFFEALFICGMEAIEVAPESRDIEHPRRLS